MRGSAFEAEGITCVKTLSTERIEYLKTWFEEFIEKQLARGVGSEGPAASEVGGSRSAQLCWPLFGFHSEGTESYHHAFTWGFFLSKRFLGLLLGGG